MAGGWRASGGWIAAVGAAGLGILALLTVRSGDTVPLWLPFAVGSAGVAALSSSYFRAAYRERERTVKNERAVARLQRQNERERKLTDALAASLDVAIFVCDNALQVRYANRAAHRLFNVEEAEGRNLLTVTLSHELTNLVAKARDAGKAMSEELAFPTPEERITIAKAWPSETGRLFLSLIEITDLRRLERIRRDFVANVSHELRTPLTVVRAMAETLLDEEPVSEAQARRYLPEMIGEIDRLSELTTDLLTLSAAESGPRRNTTCDIAGVLRSTVANLTRKAEGKGLSVHYHGPKRFLIEANPAQMAQIAINLIDNAISETDTGEVEVSCTPGENEVEIKVRDTGMGIASEHHDRVFERFYRVDKGRARSGGGTGLGLAIVRHLVEAHGGTVSLDSVLGQGTTFTVLLPVGQPRDTP